MHIRLRVELDADVNGTDSLAHAVQIAVDRLKGQEHEKFYTLIGNVRATYAETQEER